MDAAPCTILIADDEELIRDELRDLLGTPEYKLAFAGTARETWAKVEEYHPNLVLLDIKFPDSSDLGLLRRIKQQYPATEVIIISSQTDNIAQVVEAIKLGAFDYIPKPFVPEELRNRIEKALSMQLLMREKQFLVSELRERYGVQALVGGSAGMREVHEMIQRLADTDSCVLVKGETGTGKELVARALHYRSRRRSVSPFVVVNCAAIPEALVESILFGHQRGAFTGAVESAKGKIEAAGDGTVFLDEIGDMPLSQQASLLRVLEYKRFCPVGQTTERECRARFVLATNCDLRDRVDTGKFREDLFFRINVTSISVPPLRSRRQDLPLLIEYLCERLSREVGRIVTGVQPDAMHAMMKYDWPGNVRELRNVLEAAVMLSDSARSEIEMRDLPPEVTAQVTVSENSNSALSAKERQEKRKLIRALHEAGGDQTRAAELLGCHRNTVRAWIRYYGLGDLEVGL